MSVYDKVGAPITRTNSGHVLWEFPNGSTGVISKDTANYLCSVALGLAIYDGRPIKYITL